MGKVLLAYLRLLRPANIITAIADILAGTAIAGAWQVQQNLPLLVGAKTDSILWLGLASCGLYGGGVVLNDYFDAEQDKLERPERPIPSGIIPRSHAGIFGAILLLGGVVSAYQVNTISALIALLTAILVLLYDAWSNDHPFFGPLNMGLCRGANLLLGVSIIPSSLGSWYFLGLIPIAYIGAITLISQGEVHGGNRKHIHMAMGLYGVVLAAIMILGLRPVWALSIVLPYLLVFALLILPPLWKARQQPDAMHIRKAVKAGVLALIALNAAISASFAGWVFSLAILLLLPLSLLLAKLFAVT